MGLQARRARRSTNLASNSLRPRSEWLRAAPMHPDAEGALGGLFMPKTARIHMTTTHDAVPPVNRPGNEPTVRSLAAERTRLHRERRRLGLRCLMIELPETAIDVLVAKGLLNSETRHDPHVVRQRFMRISSKRWARPRDAKHEDAPRRRVPKTLRVKLLLRCNLLTYFKNFLSNLRPSGPALSAPRGHGPGTQTRGCSALTASG
jgi:hypothetical protein